MGPACASSGQRVVLFWDFRWPGKLKRASKVGDQTEVLVLAAGGIIEVQTSRGPSVAVIYRRRYGGEWALPKGKAQEGEDLQDAALREVKEETGCNCEITGFAGTTNYRYDGVVKLVLYWRMKPVGESSFQPSEEVEKLEWLRPGEALEHLNHEEEKNLIASIYGLKSAPGRKDYRARARLWVNRLLFGRRWERVASEIERYRLELNGRVQLSAGAQPNQKETACRQAASQLLLAAEAALEAGNIDAAWKHLHAAQRMEILRFDQQDPRLKNEAAVLREEAEKLNPWRKRAIDKLLGIKDSDLRPDPESLYKAAYIRDEHYANQAHKDTLLRDHARHLVLILTVLMLVLYFLIQQQYLAANLQPSMFVSVVIFGFFGGTVSAFISFPRSTASSRIPELVTANMVTLLRLFMGAASAVIVYVLLHSGLPNIFAFKLPELTPYTIFAISFVAGFTERLVLHAVEKVAGK